MAKVVCEACGTELIYSGIWPSIYWIQFGHSIHKEKYDPQEVAWWCPSCFSWIYKHFHNSVQLIEYTDATEHGPDVFITIKIGNIRTHACILFSGTFRNIIDWE